MPRYIGLRVQRNRPVETIRVTGFQGSTLVPCLRNRPDAGTPIDASGTFPDGTAFEGTAGLKRELVRQEDQFVTTMAERLLMYALGRNLHYYDAPAVRAIVRDAAAGRHTMSALVMAVVRSRPFVMRE